MHILVVPAVFHVLPDLFQICLSVVICIRPLCKTGDPVPDPVPAMTQNPNPEVILLILFSEHLSP